MTTSPDIPELKKCSGLPSFDSTYEVIGDELFIYGTEDDDNIHLNIVAKELTDPSSINYVSIFAYGCNDFIYISGSDFDRSDVSIFVYAGDGHDDVKSINSATLIIWGENGTDSLRGGDGENYIIGGEGDDYIWGGPQFDYLAGYNGDDTIFGEEGNNYATLGDGADTYFSEYDSSTGVDNEDDIYLGHKDGDIDQVYYYCTNDTIGNVEEHDSLTQLESDC